MEFFMRQEFIGPVEAVLTIKTYKAVRDHAGGYFEPLH